MIAFTRLLAVIMPEVSCAPYFLCFVKTGISHPTLPTVAQLLTPYVFAAYTPFVKPSNAVFLPL